MGRRLKPHPRETYGDTVPNETRVRLARWAVTGAAFMDLAFHLGDDWAAIEAHVKAHLVERRYSPCTTLPGTLCDRWCAYGGDPDLLADDMDQA